MSEVKKEEGLKKILNRIIKSTTFAIISSFAMLLGLIFNLFKVFGIDDSNHIFTIIGVIVLFLGAAVIISAYFYIRNENKKVIKDNQSLTKVKKENELLKIHANNGQKISENIVTIKINPNEDIYRFVFEKHFTIISEDYPNYYSAQFYANAFLNSRDIAKAFYDKHPIKWNSLKVRACISYKNPDEKNFTPEKFLEIDNITDNSNYIPFKIQYRGFKDHTRIPLKQGSEVKLKYCYNVPIELWGSYINRTLSVYGEKTIINFNVNDNLDFDYIVEELLPNGEPIDLSDSSYKTSINYQNENKMIIIELKSSPYKRYRVKWDIEKYLNNPKYRNTVDGPDEMGLTNI